MAGEKERVDVYTAAINRMEPDITPVDMPGAICSIAISLKRIADAMEHRNWLAEEARRR